MEERDESSARTRQWSGRGSAGLSLLTGGLKRELVGEISRVASGQASTGGCELGVSTGVLIR